jgi:hypothetical protein
MITVILAILLIYTCVGFGLGATTIFLMSMKATTKEWWDDYQEHTNNPVGYSTFKVLFYPLVFFMVMFGYPVIAYGLYKKYKRGESGK